MQVAVINLLVIHVVGAISAPRAAVVTLSTARVVQLLQVNLFQDVPNLRQVSNAKVPLCVPPTRFLMLLLLVLNSLLLSLSVHSSSSSALSFALAVAARSAAHAASVAVAAMPGREATIEEGLFNRR